MFYYITNTNGAISKSLKSLSHNGELYEELR